MIFPKRFSRLFSGLSFMTAVILGLVHFCSKNVMNHYKLVSSSLENVLQQPSGTVVG